MRENKVVSRRERTVACGMENRMFWHTLLPLLANALVRKGIGEQKMFSYKNGSLKYEVLVYIVSSVCPYVE